MDPNIWHDLPRRVWVFGAGITGLTAAQELAERGFTVTVFEPAINPMSVDCVAIGGLARTQWSAYQPAPKGQSSIIDDAESNPWVPTIRIRYGEDGKLDACSEIYLSRFADRLVYVWPRVPDILVTAKAGTGDDVITKVRQLLAEKCVKLDPSITEQVLIGGLRIQFEVDDLMPSGVTQITVDLRKNSARADVNVRVTQQGDLQSSILPGEHGFRFFPALYRHVFDTMKRIPVRAVDQDLEDSFRTVFDNLIPTDANWLVTAGRGCKPDGVSEVMFPRRMRKSLREYFDALNEMMKTLRYEPSEIRRAARQIFIYMTSCKRRRLEQYQDISWADFLGIPSKLTTSFEKDMMNAPQVIAAMTARDSDARTQGNLSTQLLFDPLRDDGRVDCTLNAPTSLAWFVHWKEYLESEGVQFVPGKLVRFHYSPTAQCIQPCVEYATQALAAEGEAALASAPPHFVVLAIPVEAWSKELINSWNSAKQAAGGSGPDDITKLDAWRDKYVPQKAGGSTSSTPMSQADEKTTLLRTITGMQFFFDRDIMRRRGHRLFFDSEWRLSSISQTSFWNRRREPVDGYRGLLSVDIGAAHVELDTGTEKSTFWTNDRSTVAQKVWWRASDLGDQARVSYDELPIPYRCYHIDENLRYDADPRRGLADNRTPFLTNGVGEWAMRPGWDESYARDAPKMGYQVIRPAKLIPDHKVWEPTAYVLAGTFMKTWTRATTMESANESGRHAVNAILGQIKHDIQHQGPWSDCDIWNPEDNEHPDLRVFQEIDALILAAGDGSEKIPHMLDILDLDEIPRVFLDGSVDDIVRFVARFGIRMENDNG